MKIFFLVSRIPYPIDKGDKLRAYHQIRYLSKKNNVYLYAINEENISLDDSNPLHKLCGKIKVVPFSKFRLALNLFKGLFKKIPFQTSYFYSCNAHNDIKKEIANYKPDIIFCQLIRLAEYVKDIKTTPKVLDYIDVLSKGLERRARHSAFYLKPLIKSEYERVKKYEDEIRVFFDQTIIITDEDRSQLPFKDKSQVAVIPNGIEEDYYIETLVEKKYDLMFSGNMSYPPNIEAAIYLTRKILPLLLQQKPDIKILIVGASPVKKILNLSCENIDVKSWVDDIRDCYSKTKIYIAPMQIGTGLQNKLLEAMSMKIPCVTSKLAYKGLKAEIGKEILIAKEPQEYADHIMKLLGDQSYSERVGKNGHDFVLTNYNWNIIMNNLTNILNSVVK